MSLNYKAPLGHEWGPNGHWESPTDWINTIKKTTLKQLDENGVFIFEEV